VTFAEPVDYGSNTDGSMYVEYMCESNNTTWRHGPDKTDGQWDSWELTKVPRDSIARIGRLKARVAGTVVGEETR
jgi:hypothetical protein